MKQKVAARVVTGVRNKTCSLRSSPEAEIERTTLLALVDTVLIQDEMILSELGNSPLLFPFSFLILQPNLFGKFNSVTVLLHRRRSRRLSTIIRYSDRLAL